MYHETGLRPILFHYRSAQYVHRLAVDADISIDFVSVHNHKQTK